MTKRPWVALAVGVVAIGVAAPAARAAEPGACGALGSLASETFGYDIDVVDAASGAQHAVAHTAFGLVRSGAPTQPSWSPDGRELVYGLTTYTATMATMGELRVVSSDAAHRTRVIAIPLAGAISEVAWSPDGRRIAFVLWTQNRAVQTATWTTAGDRTTIFVVNPNGSGLRPVLSLSATQVADLAWAPDGRHLAFANGIGASTIDVADVDAVVPLASAVSPRTMTATHPRWSPDGRHLAFLANGIGASVFHPSFVWITDPTGGHAYKLPLTARWESPTWSPDSHWVAVAGGRSGIAAVHIDTREIRRITYGAQDRGAAWSPDGARIAFIRPQSDKDWGTIWLVDAHNGAARPVSRPGGYVAPVWCPRA